MVLDSALNTDQYYDNTWIDSIDEADKAMEKFSSLCHSTGPEACSFWGPTPANITARIDSIIHQLQNHPIPVSGVRNRSPPELVTYSDLKGLLMLTIYEPLTSFSVMADVLHQFEHGNVSALVGMFEKLDFTSDAGQVIRCVDSYRRNKLTTMEEFRSYAAKMASKSQYVGDLFAVYVRTILCRSMRPQLPDSMMIEGELSSLYSSQSQHY